MLEILQDSNNVSNRLYIQEYLEQYRGDLVYMGDPLLLQQTPS